MITVAKLLMTIVGVIFIVLGACLAVAFWLVSGPDGPWPNRSADRAVIALCLAVACVGAGFLLQAVLS